MVLMMAVDALREKAGGKLSCLGNDKLFRVSIQSEIMGGVPTSVSRLFALNTKPKKGRIIIMLYTIAVVLLILWLAGLLTS